MKYISNIIIAGLVVAGVVEHAAAQSPDNKSTRAIAGWGELLDLDGDCDVKSADGKLTITIPAAVHSLSAYYDGKMATNAPRVLQMVDGDFTVQVKVSGEFNPGTKAVLEGRNAFNGAGLLVWDGVTNYLRLERNIWGSPDGDCFSYTPLLEHWKNAQPIISSGGGVDTAFNRQCTYLRMARHGEKFKVAFSPDGVAWTEKDEVTAAFPRRVGIGVVALNSSVKPFHVEFSEFKLTR